MMTIAFSREIPARTIFENDRLKVVKYPDPSTGAAGATIYLKEFFHYDALGELIEKTDRSQNTHVYTFDVMGRQTADTLTIAGGLFLADGVRQLATKFDAGGRASFFATNYFEYSITGITYSGNTATATVAGEEEDQPFSNGQYVEITGASEPEYNGTFVISNVSGVTFQYTMLSTPSANETGLNTIARNVRNVVQREFNGLGQLTTEYQQRDRTVDVGTSPKVQYAYDNAASADVFTHGNRLKSMTYPNGRVLHYGYTGGSGVDSNVSRVSFLADDSSGSPGTHLEDYSYLGLGTIVQRSHAENNVVMLYANQLYNDEYIRDAGDKYEGLDRFGRVTLLNWAINDNGDLLLVPDQFLYTYDRNSNRLTRAQFSNSIPLGFDEAYTYDGLNRLATMSRGTISSGSIASPNYTRDWGTGMDALGNWTSLTTDADGSGVGSPSTENRTHDSQNRLTVVGSDNLLHDHNGNLIIDENGNQLTPDGWDRLASVAYTGGSVYYEHDALGRRIAETKGGTTTQFLYSGWQVIEEKEGSLVTAQNVWSLAYVDAMVLRDRDVDTSADGTLDSNFDSDGKRIDDLGGTDFANAVAVDSNGRIVSAGRSGNDFAVVRYNRDGSLDTTFDTDGKKVFDFGGGTDYARAVAIDGAGRIVLVGVSGSDAAVARLEDDGDLDTTFSGDGKLTISGVGGAAVAIDAGGNIVIGGSSDGNLTVARIESDGDLDTTFSSDGKASADLGGTESGTSLAIRPDGTIVVAGYTIITRQFDFAVARFETDGDLDTSFSGDGMTTVSFSSSFFDVGNAVIAQPDGKIVLAGTADFAATGSDLAVARLNADGSLDTSFDSDGMLTTNTGSGESDWDGLAAVALAADGKLVVAGHNGDPGSNFDFSLARYNTDGSLDTTFDSDGKLITDLGGMDLIHGLAIDPNGRLIAVGQNGSDSAVAVYKTASTFHKGLDERLYAVHDANFNVTALINTIGGAVERYQYDPYGTPTVLDANFGADSDSISDFDWKRLHQGGAYEVATGLYHFRNRDYSATLARWLQTDPLGYADGANLYQYVGSNAVIRRDPGGLRYEDDRGDRAAGWPTKCPIPQPATPPKGGPGPGNQADNPPLLDGSSNKCGIQLRATKVGPKSVHTFVVITRPDGKQTLVRAGPLGGAASGSSEDSERMGDPCGCKNKGPYASGFGPIVPYIGPYGSGARPGGTDSPDVTSTPLFNVNLTAPGKTSCQLANCIMNVVKSLGRDCKSYVIGAAYSRNSNTVISTALTACGVSPNPLPAGTFAPGWGTLWNPPGVK